MTTWNIFSRTYVHHEFTSYDLIQLNINDTYVKGISCANNRHRLITNDLKRQIKLIQTRQIQHIRPCVHARADFKNLFTKLNYSLRVPPKWSAYQITTSACKNTLKYWKYSRRSAKTVTVTCVSVITTTVNTNNCEAVKTSNAHSCLFYH